MIPELLAIQSAGAARALPDGLTEIAQDGLAAILAPTRRPRWPSRRTLLVAAAERQARLEALMPRGTVLPSLPETRIAPAEVPTMLSANAPLLRRQLDALADRVQYQVTVGWDAAVAAATFGASDTLAPELTARIEGLLTPVAEEIQPLPVDDKTLTNHVLLIRADRDAALDAAVEAVDALWTEGLRIRQLGPAPAVSFASLGLVRLGPRAIAQALARLGLDVLPDPETLRRARHAALKAADPEARPQVVRSAEILAAAARARGPSLHLAYLWSEGRAELQADLEAVA